MNENPYLWPMLQGLPYFRALLRAVEAGFYEEFELPAPVLDIGCGDGHFAEITFDQALDLGMDPEHRSLQEAKGREVYHFLVQSRGDRQPLPSQHFASAISNSVLEHIPDVQAVLKESGRLLKPGAKLLFCVPNHRWPGNLRIAGTLERWGLKGLAGAYRRFFIRISRHVHMLSPQEWEAMLEASGFELERYWHYFPPRALHALELGHYFGLPSLLSRWLFGRWLLAPAKWNLRLIHRFLRPIAHSQPSSEGTYSWFVAKKR